MSEGQQEEFEPAATVIVARCVQSLIAWIYFVTFWYDGEPFDYTFEIGSVMIPESAAKAIVERTGFMARAQQQFLRDVHLGPTFNDVELLAA